MEQLTLKNLSNYVTISLSTEETLAHRIWITNPDDPILRAMVDYIISRR